MLAALTVGAVTAGTARLELPLAGENGLGVARRLLGDRGGSERQKNRYVAQEGHRLPEELHAHLPDSRVAGAGHIAKQAAVEIPSRVAELGVVEEVEELG